MVIQHDDLISSFLSRQDGLNGGNAVVYGYDQGIGDTFDQRFVDAIAVGKAPGNDGLGRHTKVTQKLDQDGCGGDAVGVIVTHDDYGQTILYGPLLQGLSTGGQVFNGFRFYMGRGAKLLQGQAGHALHGLGHRTVVSALFPLLHLAAPLLQKTKTEKTKRLAERQVFSSRFAPNCQFLI